MIAQKKKLKKFLNYLLRYQGTLMKKNNYGNNNVNNPFIKWRDSKDPYGDCC